MGDATRCGLRDRVMRIALSILLLAAVMLTPGIAENTTSQGWCRVYISPDRSMLRLFYEDGRYALVVARLVKHKDGTVSVEEPEDYSDRTGTWTMSDGKIESHEFSVHTG